MNIHQSFSNIIDDMIISWEKRKPSNLIVKHKGRKVQNVNTDKDFDSIGSAVKWAKCGATTLTKHLSSDGKAEWIEFL